MKHVTLWASCLALLAGCAGGSVTTVTTTATATVTESAVPAVRQTPTPTKSEESTPTPVATQERFIPAVKDWVVGVKILKKECFGSAGCNVTFRINPQLMSPLGMVAADTKLEVTYSVLGGDDGPKVNTFTSEGTRSNVDSEESLSVASAKTKIVVKVTDVTDVTDS